MLTARHWVAEPHDIAVTAPVGGVATAMSLPWTILDPVPPADSTTQDFAAGQSMAVYGTWGPAGVTGAHDVPPSVLSQMAPLIPAATQYVADPQPRTLACWVWKAAIGRAPVSTHVFPESVLR